jgi:hypothetical protein
MASDIISCERDSFTVEKYDNCHNALDSADINID